ISALCPLTSGMPDLIAQGPDPADGWRRPIPADAAVVLGRDADWPVPWDAFVSRRHAELTWRNGRLKVRRLPEATNPVFQGGSPADSCEVAPGGEFVIGRTVFTVVEGGPALTPASGRVMLDARTIPHADL